MEINRRIEQEIVIAQKSKDSLGAITTLKACFFQSAFSMGGGGGMVGVTVATLPRRCHQQSMSDTQVRMIMVVNYGII